MVTFNVDWAVTIHHHSLQHSYDLSKPVSHDLAEGMHYEWQEFFTLSHHSIHNHHKLPTRIHDFLLEGNSYTVLHDFRKQWWSDLLSIHIILVHIITHFMHTNRVCLFPWELQITYHVPRYPAVWFCCLEWSFSQQAHLSWRYWGHWTFTHFAWYSKHWGKKWLSPDVSTTMLFSSVSAIVYNKGVVSGRYDHTTSFTVRYYTYWTLPMCNSDPLILRGLLQFLDNEGLAITEHY